MLRQTSLALLLTSTAQIASAETLSIVTDISPVHGLVSMITDGISEPTLIIDPTASPHMNAMRVGRRRVAGCGCGVLGRRRAVTVARRPH